MSPYTFCWNERLYVRANIFSKEIYDSLLSRLSQFELSPIDTDVPENLDILINQVDTLWQELPGQAKLMDALYGFWVTIQNGIPTLVLLHKEKAIISISFADKININFTISGTLKYSKLTGKLFTSLLYCFRICLQSKGCLLLHGGAFTKSEANEEQASLIVLGQRGIRKTMISLTLLSRHWNYVADDKFVIEKHKVYKYQQTMLIRDHHFEQLPWLSRVVIHSQDYLKYKKWRKLFRSIAYRFIHKKLLPNEDRLFNKGIQCRVSDIFPEQITKQINTSPSVFIFKNSDTFKIQLIDKNSAIKDIQLLQRMANAEFNDWDDQLSLTHCQKVFTPSIDDFSKHLPDSQYFLVSIPYQMDIDTICDEITRCTDCQ